MRFLRASALSLGLVLAFAGGQAVRLLPHEAHAAPVAAAKRSMVFALATGLEDAQTMRSVFRHAKAAAEQKKLEEVVVLVYGRGVQALDATIAARPPQVTKLAEEAIAAGVKVKICANAMEQFGVQKDKLTPAGVEVVPNAMAVMVDYVARGAAVVRY